MQMGWYDRKVRRVRDLSCGETLIYLELEVRRVYCAGCGKVKRERLEFLRTTRSTPSALLTSSVDGAEGRR